MMRLGIVALACAVIGACGPRVSGTQDGGGDDGDGGVVIDAPHTLTSIEVTPTNPILELDLNTPGTQPFQALGRFQDGVDEDVTSRVTWSLTNPAVGAMNGATLEIPGFASVGVQVSRVVASLDDVEGQAQITVVTYRRSGTSQDFFFVLPYQDPAGPAMKPLDFGTQVPALDVFFMMDTTGSMGGEINNLRSALTGTIAPGIQNAVPNSQFGVGSFEDFPVGLFGNTQGTNCDGTTLQDHDQPFRVFQTMTSNIAAVQAATSSLVVGAAPRGCGADWPESMIEGLYLAATGQALTTPAPTNVPANTVGIGGVGFRAGTMPVIVSVSDAPSHAPGEGSTCQPTSGPPLSLDYSGSVLTAAHTRAQAKAALGAICARSVGVAALDPRGVGTCTAQRDLEDFATATGARVPPSAWDVPARPANCAAGQCCTDTNGAGRLPDADGLCPLVFRTDGSGNGLGAHIVNGIRMLTRFAAFDVTSEKQGVGTDVDGNALPSPHTTADFIKQITPTGFMLPPAPPVVPNPTFDTTTFRNVTPGTRVQFDVRALNDFVPQTQDAQIFRATIRVLAGGCTALDQREVLILVPPNPIVIQ